MLVSLGPLIGISSAAAGLVTIVVTGLRCMSRPDITMAQSRLVARYTLYGAVLFVLFVAGLAMCMLLLGP